MKKRYFSIKVGQDTYLSKDYEEEDFLEIKTFVCNNREEMSSLHFENSQGDTVVLPSALIKTAIITFYEEAQHEG